MSPVPALSRLAAALLAALLLPAAASGAEPDETALAAEFFAMPEAGVSLGAFEGSPPAAEVHRDGQLLGYLVSSRAAIGSVGYSGKPVDVWLAVDLEARVAGARLVAHQEPILVIGITPEDLEAYVAGFAGLDLEAGRLTTATRALPEAVAGATVSSAVIKDAILRSGRAVAAARGLLGTPAAGPQLDRSRFAPAGWAELIDRGALVRRDITRGEVAQVLGDTPPSAAEAEQNFITLLAGLATPPSVGQNLLGRRDYESLLAEMGAEDNLLLVAAQGLYSFKGTSYRRSGVFERIELRQDARTIKLTRDSYRNVEAFRAEGAPDLREIGVFKLPAAGGFDPARPWELVLLVSRETASGGLVVATFPLRYRPPDWIFVSADTEDATAAAPPVQAALWQEIWRERTLEIAALALLLLVLAAILVFQDSLARRYRLYRAVRIGFLVVTLVWLGWIAGAQLSVVNVLTFIQALLTGFQWELFLLDPLIFLLWGFVAVGLLFWGRGVFCGWLCPFGALQELLNMAAQRLRIPQLPIPFALHERLWPIKYILFLGLFAVSLHSVTLAFRFAEVEPFKTAIALKFLRDWPYVIYALGLLGIGLFVQRFFCRYLCPLGAALAIPARLRMFEWLKRKVQCGRECRICASRCPVQAIHPLGQINPNECIHCLNCQTLYYDATTCPPLVARAQRRARASQAAAAAGGEHAG